MNAHLTAPNVLYSDAAATSRFDLTASDTVDPDLLGLSYTHLEELDIPGVQSVEDGGGQAIIGLTSPRVIKDIRGTVSESNASKWWDVTKYANPQMKMRNEAGSWDGVRLMKSNRLLLRNYGTVTNQSTLSGATVAGQGSAATVDGYAVGQTGSTRYVTVADASGFAVGDYVAIHSQSATEDDPNGAKALTLADGTQETRRIVSIGVGGAGRIAFDRPLMKPHASGDYVTKAVTLSPIITLGGPAVVLGVGERPNLVLPPKYDDLMRINRLGWRGFFKFQMFRPEWIEVIWQAVSTD